MDRYTARMNLHGSNQRERMLNRLKINLQNKLPDSLSYKQVILNGQPTQLVINTSTKPYYKEFESLPGQMISMGDYIEWANRTWLVYETDSDDEVYIDGKMYECNYLLHWQNHKGKIISKWAFIQNASAYNNGEEENKVLTLASNQFMVWMPIDDDTVALRNGKRFFIDNYTHAPSCYELTRPDNVSMKFGNKGCTYYIFTQTETHTDKDQLIELADKSKVWIADYKEPRTPLLSSNETTILNTIITGNHHLKVGFSRTYTVSFTDESENEIDWHEVDFTWNIVSDFNNKFTWKDNGNQINLLIEDESLIGESFQLQIIIDNDVTSEINVNIIEGT